MESLLLGGALVLMMIFVMAIVRAENTADGQGDLGFFAYKKEIGEKAPKRKERH